jgi:hypothetical protein
MVVIVARDDTLPEELQRDLDRMASIRPAESSRTCRILTHTPPARVVKKVGPFSTTPGRSFLAADRLLEMGHFWRELISYQGVGSGKWPVS